MTTNARIQAAARGIRAAVSWRGLAAVLDSDDASLLDGHHHAEMLRRLPSIIGPGRDALTRVERSQLDGFVRRLMAVSSRCMGEWSAEDMSNAVWGVARSGYTPDADWIAAFRAAVGAGDSLQRVEVAIVLWSLARLQLGAPLLPASWLRPLCQRAGDLAPRMDAQSLCMVLWAVAKLGVHPAPLWLPAAFNALELQLSRCSARQLSNALWSLAVLDCAPPASLLEGLLAQCAARWPQFSPQGLSNIMWAVGRLQLSPPPPWLLAWLHHFSAALPHAAPQHISMAMWALAALHTRGDVGGSSSSSSSSSHGTVNGRGSTSGVDADGVYTSCSATWGDSGGVNGDERVDGDRVPALPPPAPVLSWVSTTVAAAARGALPEGSAGTILTDGAQAVPTQRVPGAGQQGQMMSAEHCSQVVGGAAAVAEAPSAEPLTPQRLQAAGARAATVASAPCTPPLASTSDPSSAASSVGPLWSRAGSWSGLSAPLPASFTSGVVSASMPRLSEFSAQELSVLLWALARLRLGRQQTATRAVAGAGAGATAMLRPSLGISAATTTTPRRTASEASTSQSPTRTSQNRSSTAAAAPAPAPTATVSPSSSLSTAPQVQQPPIAAARAGRAVVSSPEALTAPASLPSSGTAARALPAHSPAGSNRVSPLDLDASHAHKRYGSTQAAGAAESAVMELGGSGGGGMVGLGGSPEGSSWLSECAQHALDGISSAQPQTVSVLTWSLARLGYLPRAPWQRTFQVRTLQALPYFAPQALANTLLAMTLMRVRLRPPWRAAFYHASQQQLRQFAPRELASTLWAVSRAFTSRSQSPPPVPPRWLSATEAAMHASLPQASRGDIAVALLAMARLRHAASDVFLKDALACFVERMAVAAGGRDGVEGAAAAADGGGRRAMDVANVLWSLAMFRFDVGTSVLLGLLSEAGPGLGSCSHQELAQLVWAVARFGHRPPEPWLRRLEASVAQRVSELSNLSAYTLLVGMSDIGYRPSDAWLAAVHARFLSTAAAQSKRLGEGRTQNAASVVDSALAALQYSTALPIALPTSSTGPQSTTIRPSPSSVAVGSIPTGTAESNGRAASSASATRPVANGVESNPLLVGFMAVVAGAAAAVTGPLL